MLLIFVKRFSSSCDRRRKSNEDLSVPSVPPVSLPSYSPAPSSLSFSANTWTTSGKSVVPSGYGRKVKIKKFSYLNFKLCLQNLKFSFRHKLNFKVCSQSLKFSFRPKLNFKLCPCSNFFLLARKSVSFHSLLRPT